jgi:hypothetical protein
MADEFVQNLHVGAAGEKEEEDAFDWPEVPAFSASFLAICSHTFPASRFDWYCRPDWFFFSQHVPFLSPDLPYVQYRHWSFARHFEQQSDELDAVTPPLMRSAPW